MENSNFQYQLDTINKVLRGEGEELESLDDLTGLFDSTSPGGILLPRTVGIFQEHNWGEIPDEARAHVRAMEAQLHHATQEVVERATGGKDAVHPNLICLVYDPDVFSPTVMRELLTDQDRMGRIKIASYLEVPEFETKPNMGHARFSAYKAMDDPSKMHLSVLERDRDIFQLTERDYGLTRHEAAAYYSVCGLLSRLEGNPDLTVPKGFTEGLGMVGKLMERLAEFKDKNKEK